MWVNKKVEEEENYIGEVYLKHYSYYGLNYWWEWQKFKSSNRDYSRDHDDYVCIFGKCHKRDYLFYYDELYKPLRKKIERKNRNATTNKT